MILQGTILSNETGQPIPYASVTIIQPSGTPTGIGVSANSQGWYYLNSNIAEYPNFLVFSSTGYNTAMIQLYDDYNIDYAGDVFLDKKVKELPGVVLPPAGNKDMNYAWLLLLGIPLLMNREKEKTVGKVDTGTVIAVGAGLAIFKGFGLLNSLLTTLGIGESSGASAQESNPNSAWQPDYWKKYQNDPALIPHLAGKDAWFKDQCWTIWYALDLWSDNWNSIKGVFDQINTKTEVSYFSNVFYNTFGLSLLTYLKNGDGLTPADGLSDSHMKTLIDLVAKLPIK